MGGFFGVLDAEAQIEREEAGVHISQPELEVLFHAALDFGEGAAFIRRRGRTANWWASR